MSKRPSPAEVKQQSEDLGKKISDLRKKQHFFAMLIGKEGLAFSIDRKKSSDILWRKAKQESGGSKGAKGTATVNGKVLELNCDDPDSVPGSLLKLARKHFQDLGQPIRITFKDVEDKVGRNDDEGNLFANTAAGVKPKKTTPATPNHQSNEKTVGEGSQEPLDQLDKPVADRTSKQSVNPRVKAAQKALVREFRSLRPQMQAALASSNPKLKNRVLTLARLFAKLVKLDVKKAFDVFKLLRKILKAEQAATKPVTDSSSQRVEGVERIARESTEEVGEETVERGARESSEAASRASQSLDWPDRLTPSGKRGGTPDTTKRKSVFSARNADEAREIAMDNEAADALADHGYEVVQNPGKRSNGKEPDFLIEGEWADNYAVKPNTDAFNVCDEIGKKLGSSRSAGGAVPERVQAKRIVLTLNEWGGDLDELRHAVMDYRLSGTDQSLVDMGLKELIVVLDGEVFNL